MPAIPRSSRHALSNGHDKPPPHDIEAEVQLLGCLQFGRDDHRLHRKHFYLRGHRLIFDVLVEMRAEGEPLEAHLVARKLEHRGHLKDVGGIRKIIDILESVPHADHIDHYAAIVLDCYRRRRLIEQAAKLNEIARDWSADLDQAVSEIDLHGLVGSDRSRERLHILSAEEFARANYRMHFHCRRVLVAGQPMLVGGPEKSLKTTILADLAISLGAGRMFLGEFDIPQRVNVGLLSGESGGYTLQETAKRICKSKGITLESTNTHWCMQLPQLSQPADLMLLVREVERLKLDVAIVDPAYLCLLDDGNADAAGNHFRIGPILKRFSDALTSIGCTPILSQHATKSAGRTYEPLELQDLAFAGFREYARQWILVNRREKFDPDAGLHKLWLTIGGSAGHSGIYGLDADVGVMDDDFRGREWEVQVSRQGDLLNSESSNRSAKRREDEQRQQEVYRDQIIAMMRTTPSGNTMSATREACGINSRYFARPWASLIEDGTIVATKITKTNGRTYEGFKLP
jgi:hypothetical protein